MSSKFILDDYFSNYETHLLCVGIVPLTYTLNFYDIMVIGKALQEPSSHYHAAHIFQFYQHLAKLCSHK